MSNLVFDFRQAIVWVLFFATTVYGHVGLKLAVANRQKAFEIFGSLFSFWGFSSIVAWIVSALLWMLILARAPLFTANSISSLRYLLVSIAAMLFLRERIGINEFIGMILILFGIWLVVRTTP